MDSSNNNLPTHLVCEEYFKGKEGGEGCLEKNKNICSKDSQGKYFFKLLFVIKCFANIELFIK